MKDLNEKIINKLQEINNSVLLSFNESQRDELINLKLDIAYIRTIANQIIHFSTEMLHNNRITEYQFYDYTNKKEKKLRTSPYYNDCENEDFKRYMNDNCINFKGMDSYKSEIDLDTHYNACIWVLNKINITNIYEELKRRYKLILCATNRSIIPPVFYKKKHKWCIIYEIYGVRTEFNDKEKVDYNEIYPLYFQKDADVAFYKKKEEFIDKYWWVKDIVNHKEFSDVEEYEDGELIKINGRSPCLADDFFDYDILYSHNDKKFEINRKIQKRKIKIEKFINKKELYILN